MAFLKLTTDRIVKRLRWVMVGAALLDTFSTLLGQPSTYWQHPETAAELSRFWHHSLSRGWPFYCLDSLINIVLVFLIVSIIPRRIALFVIFYYILGHYFGASSWLCYHWHFGVGWILIYSGIFSAILVLLAFPKPSKAPDGLLSHEPDATMGTFKTILLVICVTLVLADDGWRIWAGHDYAGYRAFARQFRLEVSHTNDVSGVGIVEAKTGKLLWAEWDYTNNGKEFSYFYRGTNIFNLNVWPGRPLTYSVGFHGPGKSSVWWWDLARGTFVERNFFNTNGDFSKFQVWYNHTWHNAVTRNGKSGIIINGQWRQLSLPTNSMWTIEGASTNQLSPNTALEPL